MRSIGMRRCRWLRLGLVLVLSAAWLGAAVGCRPPGPKRYRLHGNVTYQGQPVPSGQILFEPDESKGNSGPQGSAPIRDGMYDTRNGKGTVGGPHVVRIKGFDRFSQDETRPARPLFAEYKTEVDLPKETFEFDFQLPGPEAAEPASGEGEPGAG